MAKQHFYSRVPARGSLFNRSDGFDTFAQGLYRGAERLSLPQPDPFR